jgi:hypothetical protein
MANVKVTCPRCGHQTWVREHYSDPCQPRGKAFPDPYIKLHQVSDIGQAVAGLIWSSA